MSKLEKVIKRTENWLNDWATNDPTGLASDIRFLIGTARTTIQAVEVLRQSQRHDLNSDGYGEPMVPSAEGDYIYIGDVDQVVKILQKEQHE